MHAGNMRRKLCLFEMESSVNAAAHKQIRQMQSSASLAMHSQQLSAFNLPNFWLKDPNLAKWSYDKRRSTLQATKSNIECCEVGVVPTLLVSQADMLQ